MKKINNFVKIDSERGPFIVNRHCSFQAEHMIKTGQTHIEQELNNILGIAKLLPAMTSYSRKLCLNMTTSQNKEWR